MKTGDIAPNFEILLVDERKVELYELLKNGPVVLNFIMGTWCPFCTNHLKKVRQWQEKLSKKTTMIIISSEHYLKLQSWSKKNQTSYLYASDPELEVIKLYEAKNLLLNTATPVTVLIDTDKTIKIYFNGIRNKSSRDNLINKICKTCS